MDLKKHKSKTLFNSQGEVTIVKNIKNTTVSKLFWINDATQELKHVSVDIQSSF